MQKDEATHQAIQDELKTLGLDEMGSKKFTMKELEQRAPVLAKELLLARAFVDHVTDKDTALPPLKEVEFNVQQGKAGKFGMEYGGALRFDVDNFMKIDMPELRTVMQHELGHYAEFLSRPSGENQPSIKDPNNQQQVSELRDHHYKKEFQADWYADALTGVYSHLKGLQRKPESYDPIEKSPDHPDRKSRINALISELYVAGSEKNDMPQSGNIESIVANRTRGAPAAQEAIADKMKALDSLVKSGLTDEKIDQFVTNLDQSAKQFHISNLQSDLQGNQNRLALANVYLLNPDASKDKSLDDALAPLYLKRNLLLNEVASSPYAAEDKLRLEVQAESRFDVLAHRQIVAGNIRKLDVLAESENTTVQL